MHTARFVCAMVFACWLPAVAAQHAGPSPVPTQAIQNSTELVRRVDGVPVYKTESRLVVVDVIARDNKNNAVTGLSKEDFVLRENGVVQTLTGFEEHTMPAPGNLPGAGTRDPLPLNTFSNAKPPFTESTSILLVLEVAGSVADTVEQMRERQEMLAYMKTVPPGTRIAIVQLDSSVHLVQGFSSDPATLLAAVQSKRDYPKLPIALTREDAEIALDRAVAQITGYLSYFPGRKSVIWFGPTSTAAGLTTRFSDRLSFLDEVNRTTPVLTLEQIAVFVILPGVGEYGFGKLLPAGAAQQQNPRIDAQDVLGLSGASVGSGWASSTQEMLRRSGGDLIYNTNGVREAIHQIADGAWNYYTLSYTPSNRTLDGRYRHLELETPGRKLFLQNRAGYYAHPMTVQPDTPAINAANPEWVALDAAMALGGPNVHDVLFTAHIDPAKRVTGAMPMGLGIDNNPSPKYRGKPSRQYAITYNVNFANFKISPEEGSHVRAGLKVVAVVYDSDGNVVNSQSKSITQEMTGKYYLRQVASHGLEVSETIGIPAKGNFFLRLGVQDEMSKELGVLEVPVDQIKIH